MHHGYVTNCLDTCIKDTCIIKTCFMNACINGHLCGSHSLSGRRAWKTKLSRLEGPKAGTKGHKLEVGAQRAPRLSLTFSQGGPGKERVLKRKKEKLDAGVISSPSGCPHLANCCQACRPPCLPMPGQMHFFVFNILVFFFFILHLANCSLACSRDTYWWDAHRISKVLRWRRKVLTQIKKYSDALSKFWDKAGSTISTIATAVECPFD